MCRGCRKVVKSGWQVVRPMDALPANRSWQPSCSHGTYQHETITSRSRQLLMMGTWLPETCWATSRREIKNIKVTSSWFFLSTLKREILVLTAQLTLIVEIVTKVRECKLSQVNETRIQSVSCKELWNKRVDFHPQMVLTLLYRISASSVLAKLSDNTENTWSNDYECTWKLKFFIFHADAFKL